MKKPSAALAAEGFFFFPGKLPARFYGILKIRLNGFCLFGFEKSNRTRRSRVEKERSYSAYVESRTVNR